MARAARVHRIRIESASETQNSAGEPIPSWSPFAVVWAAVVPLHGDESFGGREVNATVSHRIEMHYLSGVTPKMRATFKDRIFDFQQVVNVGERNRDMEILALERDA